MLPNRHPEMKKGIRYFYLTPHILVRLAGIEPTTPWFVAKYSIQLSYSRVAKIITLPSCFWKAGTAAFRTATPLFSPVSTR
jgi:hypothetical protein